MRKIAVVLPPYRWLPARRVRAEQFYDELSTRYELMIFDLAAPGLIEKSRFGRYLWVLICLLNLFLHKKTIWRVYVVKNTNVTLQNLMNMMFKERLVLDINDPIHKQFSDQHAKELFRNVPFLMVENFRLEREYARYAKRISVNEDYPMTNEFDINFSDKKKICIWFGSHDTWMYAHDVIAQIADLLNLYKYRLVLLGVPDDVCLEYSDLVCYRAVFYKYTDLLYWGRRARVSIVPFDSSSDLSLRGNLKLRISMAAGLCAFAQDISMHRDAIINWSNGVLCGDDQWLKNLSDVISNEHVLYSIAKNAREYAVTNFDKNIWIDNLEAAFTSLESENIKKSVY